MNEIERIEEVRFVESLISLWMQPDAPKWLIDYVRTELRKQRGLLEEKDLKAMEKVNGRYSEDIMNSLVNMMIVFLKDHEIYKLMELVADAVATKEQEAIDSFDAHNAPELIRCKDCKFQINRGRKYPECDQHFLWAKDDWFCADGERK